MKDAGSVPRISATRIEAAISEAIGARAAPGDDQVGCDALRDTVERVIITREGFTLIPRSDTPPLKVAHSCAQTDTREPPDWQNPHSSQQQALTQSIVRAHHWLDLLASGRTESIEEMAE